MKIDLFNKEAKKLWKEMSSEQTTELLHLELDLYKKLLNFFQVGDYYYYIFNIKNMEFELVSPLVETVLGYEHEIVTVPFFIDCLHPDDRAWFLAFETKTAQFLSGLPVDKLMKYKVRYDFRLKKKNGDYIRVLHQVAVVEHDDQGGIARTLGIHTDITHVKPDGKPIISYIGMDGEPSYFDIDVTGLLLESKKVLSNREKQVLSLLMEGKLSKEISDILKISKHTVDTHRKNMIMRNNLNNTSELIVKAIKEGWI